jgi:selenocysteine-specific elongation factor
VTVVVGTAGHIDHGKTALLRALTGIDADRLPEERRRGMTIDVGYAHLALPDGSVIDFVDVPGHDRLVGNMLVGAGEVDAAMLVVAADDGPNAQTYEHLELLDALGIGAGLAVITKVDLVAGAAERQARVEEVAALLARTTLAGVPVLLASAVTGEGIEGVRDALGRLAEVIETSTGGLSGSRPTAAHLAVDRVFPVKGRGTVVTGSLHGGSVRTGATLRLVPGDARVRVREVQARGATVEEVASGRAALLLGGTEPGELRRGQVLTADPGVIATSRLLVAIRAAAALVPGRAPSPPPADRERLRLHLATEQVDALVVRGPREAIELPDGSSLALLRLEREIAVAPGDRFAMRRPSPGSTAGGGVVLDADPPRGISRRRLTADRATALRTGGPDARLDLHGALVREGEPPRLAPDVATALAGRAMALVAEHHAAQPASPGIPLATLRPALAIAARRLATLGRTAADAVARATIDGLVADGSLARDGDLLRDATRAAGLPAEVRAAMGRLEAALDVPAPPALGEAARIAGCPAEGIRALEREGRIVRPEPDLAWAATRYRELARQAVSMAAAGPLTPAAFRDATGTSRRYVLVILEDLDRRELLRRTDAGHVLGARTIARLRARSSGEPAS